MRRRSRGRTAGGAGRPASPTAGPAPRGSGTRSGPRTRAARTAAGPPRWRPGGASGSRPPSAASMVARVRSRPMPRRRQAGSTKIVPIQPTGPLRPMTPVPTTPAVGFGDERPGLRVGDRRNRGRAGGRPSPRAGRRPTIGSTSAGVMGRMTRAACIRPIASAGSSVGYHPSAMATLSRSDVEHVAHLARLGLTDAELTRLEGAAQPHPRPVRDPGRAADRRHPADRPDDRAREHPARGRRPAVAAGRGGPRQRAGTRRRLHRRPGDPRRALTADDRLTRLHAHEMAALLRTGEVSSRELTEAHLAAAERDNRGAQRLADDRSRAGARRGRRRRRPAGRRPDRPGRTRSTGSARCSASRSRSRTSSRWPAASAPPARGSSRATARRTTPTSPSGCARPAR